VVLRKGFCKGQSAGFPSVVRAIIAGERVLPELLEIVMSRIRHPYPSDLSDEEWALLEPLLASSERRGRPPKWSARRVADAVFYLLRSGCAWRKRHFLVEINGLVLAARVQGANLPDWDGDRRLLAEGLERKLPRLGLAWAAGAYTDRFREWAKEELGWRVEVPCHRDRQLWR
jgi:hypothetical protein